MEEFFYIKSTLIKFFNPITIYYIIILKYKFDKIQLNLVHIHQRQSGNCKLQYVEVVNIDLFVFELLIIYKCARQTEGMWR